jgi:hypothetical protein
MKFSLIFLHQKNPREMISTKDDHDAKIHSVQTNPQEINPCHPQMN